MTEISIVEAGIMAALGQQAGVAALLNNLTRFQHDNAVSGFDCRETVGNEGAGGVG